MMMVEFKWPFWSYKNFLTKYEYIKAGRDSVDYEYEFSLVA